MSVFNTLGIKCIYSKPYYHQGNGRIENVHNFFKCTIEKSTYGSQLKWAIALPLATYCYNIPPSVDDLESPFYLYMAKTSWREGKVIYRIIVDTWLINLEGWLYRNCEECGVEAPC